MRAAVLRYLKVYYNVSTRRLVVHKSTCVQMTISVVHLLCSSAATTVVGNGK